jgi:hypothetical protein
MSDPVDLIEIEPGIYGLKPVDPYAHQWAAFWASLKFLAIWMTIIGIIDILVTY